VSSELMLLLALVLGVIAEHLPVFRH